MSHARAWRFIVLMSVVAMCGDMTYEGARSINGPFLGALGASAATIGFVAGLGEWIGYAVRLASGWLADRTRAYWLFTFAGYGTNLLVVPTLALVGDVRMGVALLLLERLGKALRSPARSTLVSFAATRVGPGRSFALDEALDQVGAVVGPLAVAWAVARSSGVGADRLRPGFAVLALPAAATLVVLTFAHRRFPDPEAFETGAATGAAKAPLRARAVWPYLIGVALVAAGTFDWALLAIAGQRRSVITATQLPLVYAVAMGVDALSALAFGWLFDRLGARALMALVPAALLTAVVGPVALTAHGPVAFWVAAALWGAAMGAQESIFKAGIATLVDKQRRARAYGLFYFVYGGAWWAGSATLGALLDRGRGALVFSAGCSLVAVPVLVWAAARHARTSQG